MSRFSNVDYAVAASCLALAMLSLAFSKTNGLVATWDPAVGPYYSHQYNSTGSDDDLMIQAGSVIFGAHYLLFGWWPSRSALRAAKVITFAVACAVQLLALHWIEVGSLSLTVLQDHNVVLALWLIWYVLSLPVVCALFVVSLRDGGDAPTPERAI